MFVDLDNFKEVNDKLGHDGGDLLLRRFADALTALLPETDCIARLGGVVGQPAAQRRHVGGRVQVGGVKNDEVGHGARAC